jgi:hypothetical protein
LHAGQSRFPAGPTGMANDVPPMMA